ncbi:MAG TPA: ABC transporter permease [Gemmatimonadales bacterium]|nr:ABC transporter permease [Gemmatimonadales bacterium]
MVETTRRLLHRIRQLFRRSATEVAMDAEMRHHIECETAAGIAAGLSPGEARRVALRDFGGVERFKEQARDERGFRPLEDLAGDIRYAARGLRNNPGYALAAVLTFALGIGLATAIYSVVHGVLLQPLPYARADRLVALWERNVAGGAERNVVSVPNFEAWRDRTRSFAGMAALVPQPVTLDGPDPERVMGALVSPGYFGLLGVPPEAGRDFAAGDIPRDAVILSDGLWRRRFSADHQIIGSSVRLDGKPFTVVGVMPAGFDPPRFGWLPDQELWFPFVATPANREWGRFLLVVGRLRDGVSVPMARMDLGAVADQLGHENPSDSGWSTALVPLAEQITGDVKTPLLIMLGAVALLFLMAAINVGALTLGWVRRRERELAVRRAIGASAGRIFRQVLTHSLVLGVIGSAVGVVAALAGTRVLTVLMPPDVPRTGDIRIDGAVLLFATVAAVAATAAFGGFAAFRSARLQGTVAAPTQGRVTRRLGGGSLVIAEAGLGVVLTILAGVMVRSFANLRAVNLGFEPGGVVAARISLPGVSYGTLEADRQFFDALTDRLRSAPGVRAASAATTLPLWCCAPATDAWDAATPPSGGAAPPTVDVRYVDSSYFVALRIPIDRGRGFAGREPTGGLPHLLINQHLARALWGDADPVGRRLHVDLGDWQTQRPMADAEVSGVVGDVRLADPRTPPRGTVYLSTARFPSSVRDIIVRGDGRSDALVGALRAAVRSLDPALPLSMVTSVPDAVDRSLARDRFTTLILSVFAVVALLLAAVGMYGVFAAEVGARRKEIGVRLALGARGAGVIRLVVRRAALLAGVGVTLGVGAALLLTRSMASLLFGVGASDPVSVAGAALLLLSVALAATAIPAVRAARTSPLEAIHSD